jgi:hypothetical protein
VSNVNQQTLTIFPVTRHLEQEPMLSHDFGDELPWTLSIGVINWFTTSYHAGAHYSRLRRTMDKSSGFSAQEDFINENESASLHYFTDELLPKNNGNSSILHARSRTKLQSGQD